MAPSQAAGRPELQSADDLAALMRRIDGVAHEINELNVAIGKRIGRADIADERLSALDGRPGATSRLARPPAPATPPTVAPER